MNLPDTWVTPRLGEICTLNPPLLTEERPDLSTLVSFVPMSGVDEVRAEISTPELKPYAEVMRGYTPFRTGDVLFAKITPSMENGKAAIAQHLEGGLGFGSTEFHVLRPKAHLLPEYLLHFIRQDWFRKRAATAFIGSAGQQRVPSGFLARLKFPLPTIPEQRRIIGILREAEETVVGRGNFGEQTQAILHAALDSLVFSRTGHDVERLGNLSETRYGTSVSAEATFDNGLPVLRIPNVVTGEINTSNLRFVALQTEEVDRLSLRYGDVLIVRSNGNPNYVGRAAPVTNSLAQAQYVYASYLIRVRLNIERIRPEYLSCFFNSPYGRAALRNAIRTTAGQSNISAEALSRIKIPIAPIKQQLLLADVWNSLQELRGLIVEAERLGNTLLEDMRLDAFSGALTEQWRAQNYSDLQNEDRERRAALGLASWRAAVKDERHDRSLDSGLATRTWLVGQLSEFQRSVRMALSTSKGTVTPDENETFDDFCRQVAVEHERNAKDRVRRALEQLAALGLIVKLSLRNMSGNFVTAYRSLRQDEDTRLADAQSIQSRLSKAAEIQENE